MRSTLYTNSLDQIWLNELLVQKLILFCALALILIIISEIKEKRRKGAEEKKDIPFSKKSPPTKARVGKSVADERQIVPLDDSILKDEVSDNKAHIFEPRMSESDSNPKDLLIDADPTEAIDEEEEIASYTGEEVYTAGGMDYDVMQKTVGVINDRTSDLNEEKQAGKVLHDNQDTALVNQMMASKGALSLRIASLIDLRLQEYAEEEKQGVAPHSNKSTDFESFDANKYF